MVVNSACEETPHILRHVDCDAARGIIDLPVELSWEGDHCMSIAIGPHYVVSSEVLLAEKASGCEFLPELHSMA